MSLCLIATPIGNPKDISLRAVEYLKSCDVIIGEEERELSKFLKMTGVEAKSTELLNEHSTPGDLKRLLGIAKEKKVALVSDCGTPAFCDPGADLVEMCYALGVPVTTMPGASSVMAALSLSGFDLREFVFKGFLSQKTEERAAEVKELVKEKRPIVLMDTPYRLEKLAGELNQEMGNRPVFLAANTTQRDEWSFRGLVKDLVSKVAGKKAEFVIVLGPR
jgi:16S rRNA (cytidine1402-2'-O)-methyltransferase